MGEAATFYRRGVAKINYLAQDRGDLTFASKELSRCMSSPCESDLPGLRRVARYLKSHPTWDAKYAWQEPTEIVQIYPDSDWGGCVKTRKSTTGGVIMKGTHCLSHWSRTQQLISLSSAEAELNASIRAGQEGLGIKHFSEEIGNPHRALVLGDSSASHGINMRSGSGRVNHLSIRQLWLQERVQMGHLTVKKIPREENCADAMTHHWVAKDSATHFAKMHSYRSGPKIAERTVGPEGGSKRTAAGKNSDSNVYRTTSVQCMSV